MGIFPWTFLPATRLQNSVQNSLNDTKPESLCHWGMRQSGVQMAVKNPPCWCTLDREQHPILKERSFTSQSALLHKRWDSLWPLHCTAGSGYLSGRFRLVHHFFWFSELCVKIIGSPALLADLLALQFHKYPVIYLVDVYSFKPEQPVTCMFGWLLLCLLLAFRSNES